MSYIHIMLNSIADMTLDDLLRSDFRNNYIDIKNELIKYLPSLEDPMYTFILHRINMMQRHLNIPRDELIKIQQS